MFKTVIGNNLNPEETEYNWLLKAVVIGPPNSGKSALIQRFADNQFIQSDRRLVLDYKVAQYELPGNKIAKLQVWDEPQQFQTSYFRSADVILVTCDLSDPECKRKTTEQINLARKSAPKKDIILVGTKADARDETNDGLLRSLQEEFEREDPTRSYGWREVSALTGENVANLFAEVNDRALIRREVDKQHYIVRGRGGNWLNTLVQPITPPVLLASAPQAGPPVGGPAISLSPQASSSPSVAPGDTSSYGEIKNSLSTPSPAPVSGGGPDLERPAPAPTLMTSAGVPGSVNSPASPPITASSRAFPKSPPAVYLSEGPTQKQQSYWQEMKVVWNAKENARDTDRGKAFRLLENYTQKWRSFHWGRDHTEAVQLILNDWQHVKDVAAVIERLEQIKSPVSTSNPTGKINQEGDLNALIKFLRGLPQSAAQEQQQPALTTIPRMGKGPS